jgi:hypothetical protein
MLPQDFDFLNLLDGGSSQFSTPSIQDDTNNTQENFDNFMDFSQPQTKNKPTTTFQKKIK